MYVVPAARREKQRIVGLNKWRGQSHRTISIKPCSFGSEVKNLCHYVNITVSYWSYWCPITQHSKCLSVMMHRDGVRL